MAREVVVLLSHFFAESLTNSARRSSPVLSAPLNWFELPVAAGAVARSLDPTGGHQGAPWAGLVPLQALPTSAPDQGPGPHGHGKERDPAGQDRHVGGERLGSARLARLPKPSTTGIAVPRPYDEEVDRLDRILHSMCKDDPGYQAVYRVGRLFAAVWPRSRCESLQLPTSSVLVGWPDAFTAVADEFHAIAESRSST